MRPLALCSCPTPGETLMMSHSTDSVQKAAAIKTRGNPTTVDLVLEMAR